MSVPFLKQMLIKFGISLVSRDVSCCFSLPRSHTSKWQSSKSSLGLSCSHNHLSHWLKNERRAGFVGKRHWWIRLTTENDCWVQYKRKVFRQKWGECCKLKKRNKVARRVSAHEDDIKHAGKARRAERNCQLREQDTEQRAEITKHF